MNKSAIRTTLLSLMALVLSISACVKGDFDEPPINIPTVDFSSNTTIAALKVLYQGSLDSISDDLIIKGKVVANDESGNLYKKLVIQDETAGIEILLNKTSLYNEYKLGQEVYVKCKGMYLGDYGGLVQLGYTYENKIGQLPEILIPDHLFRDSLPGGIPEPVQLNLGADNSAYLSMLVSIDNATFADGGKNTWATADATTNRTLTAGGKSIIVRTSNYASFALDTIPAGFGKVYGILSSYNGTLQLTVRDTSDVKGFSGVIPPSADFVFPATGISPVTSIDEKFDNAIASTDIAIEGWTNQAATGSRNWQGKTFQSEKYAQASSYNTSDAENKPWLITPPIVYSSSLKLSFKSEKAYFVTDQLSVWLLYNYTGDASAATWTKINATLAGASNPDYTWVPSGDINLADYVPSGYTGNVYIGFKYEGTATNTTTFCLDDILVGTGGGGGGGTSTVLLQESFDVQPSTWVTYSVASSQNWTFDGTYKYMWANGYGGDTGADDWLITPAIDFTGASDDSLTFRAWTKYTDTGLTDPFTVLISTDYSGTGDPSVATWTPLSATLPAANSAAWTDCKAYIPGITSTAYIAFRYKSSGTGSNTASKWEVDNVKVTGKF